MSAFAGAGAVLHGTEVPAEARRAVRSVRAAARRRVVGVSLVLAVAVVLAFALEISLGDYPIALRDVPATLLGGGDPTARYIVDTIRLPRALVGLLVGVAFGASGAVFQTMARNSLASPDVIGITTGASIAAVAALVVVDGLTALQVSLGALVGATLMALAIFVLAYRRGVSMTRLILVGIGLQLAGESYLSFLLAGLDDRAAERADVWLSGSLSARTWEQVRLVAVALLVLVPLVLALQRRLRALQLGDDVAAGVGVDVTTARAALLVAGSGLAAFGVAGAGPVALVAFIAPAIARWSCRTGRPLVAPSALVGAALVLFADAAGRAAFGDVRVPVGIVTGLIGGPYFVWLLVRSDRAGLE